jgi:L-alanine-DL-glutamate epimerase-like enolase superfamily enzyme
MNSPRPIFTKTPCMSAQTTLQTIELYKLFIPLKEPFVISLGPIHEVQNVVVILRTADGCAGYGECSPYMSINGESVDTCFIVGQYFAKVLKGKDALDIAGCMELMDRTIYGNTSIKSAFDMALHDIAAQHAGIPLYQYLGGQNNKVLETDYTISIGEPSRMQAHAITLLEEGYPAIKVKLGGSLEEDVARIRAIREGIGSTHPLRIDANQGWQTADKAIAVLQALAPYNIEHCEEPIARYRFMDLRKVSEASPIPIMADESCGDEHDAERLIALKACSMFNIKLGKSSGFHKGMKIARLGAEAGMEMQVGGFMESRLGMTAAAHLALSNDHIHHCDFDTPLMYTEDPVIGGIQYGPKGRIEVPDTPGLGAVIDESWLKKGERFLA